jgi:hypothetical protein
MHGCGILFFKGSPGGLCGAVRLELPGTEACKSWWVTPSGHAELWVQFSRYTNFSTGRA